jgi:MFS family permease
MTLNDPTPAEKVTTVAGQGTPATAPLAGYDVPNAASSFGRVMGSMGSSYAGVFIGLLVPSSLLLTLHLTDLVGKAQLAEAVSIVTGVGALTALIVNPLAGRISDHTWVRFGRRRTWIISGGIGGALVVIALAFTTEVWQVAVLWSLVQGLFNLQLAATGALMADQVPAARRGSISGVLGFIVAFGPLAGLAAVTPFHGWAQWAVVGALAMIGAVLSVLLLRDPLPHGERPPLNLRTIITSYWLNPRRHPAFGWAWLVRFLVSCSAAATTYYGVYLLQRMGVSTDALSGAVLGLSATYVTIGGITSMLGGVLSDRFQRQKPFVLGSGVIQAVGLLVLAFAPSMPFVYLAVGVCGFGAGIFLSVDVALCSRMLPDPANIGKDYAVINLANALPTSLVPFAAPALLALGGFPVLYITLAITGLVGGILVLRLPDLGQEGDPRFAQLTVER